MVFEEASPLEGKNKKMESVTDLWSFWRLVIQASGRIQRNSHRRRLFYYSLFHYINIWTGYTNNKMCDRNRNALDFWLWEEIPLREAIVGYIAFNSKLVV